MLTECKALLKKNWFCYLTGIALILGLKQYNSTASAEDLKWILTPTARWVRTLSGIAFEWAPKEGYVNHALQFVIAPSCSGIQFMTISTAVLIFSFVHRITERNCSKRGSVCTGLCWITLSLLISYAFTILVNGLRILLSIDLPIYVNRISALQGLFTPEKLHTLIGTVVYFSSLLLLYNLSGIFLKIQSRKLLFPLFWYLFIVLGIPFLNRAYGRDPASFTGYAALVTSVCSIVILLPLAGRLYAKRRNL